MSKKKFAQPLIVAVETSGRRGSAALASGSQLLGQADFSAPMRHGAELFGAIENLLLRFDKEASAIEQVHLSIGPGSFTGLRIAATFARTLHLANAAKVVTVGTSDVIVANIVEATAAVRPDYARLATILDAKRGQFFVAAYEQAEGTISNVENTTPLKGYEKILADCLMTAEQFVEQFADSGPAIGLLGEGLVYYADKFRATALEIIDEQYWWPRASNVHRLGWSKAQRGEFADPLELQPVYLREPQLGISRIRRNG